MNMDLELKHKAYQVLIDKIDVITFEEYLYKKVEEIEDFKSDSILFDFLCIDYKYENYRKEFKNLIEDSFSEEELLSLKIYEECLNISKIDDKKDIYKSLDEFYDLYISYEYNYELLYGFYLLIVEKDSIEYGYSLINEKELLIKIKKHTSKVLERFEFYREKEDWKTFLDEVIYIEPEKKMIKIEVENASIEKVTSKKRFENIVLDNLKGIFGIR